MPELKVAHINKSNVDLIIIPFKSSFGSIGWEEQRAIIKELQLRATSAALAGTVVPVWDAGMGRMAYIAPSNWHPFFDRIDLRWVWTNINLKLFW